MKSILVTGAAGFIGYHLIKTMVSLGFPVVGIDNLQGSCDPDIKTLRLKELGLSMNSDTFTGTSSSGLFVFYKCDINDTETVNKIMSAYSIEFVVHLAASTGVRNSVLYPELYIKNNILGFQNIIQMCRQHKIDKLIYASSSSVYGENPNMPYAEDFSTDKPVSVYAFTKKANELMASVYAGLYGINSVGLRFFTVYGPWVRTDMASYIFMQAISSGNTIQMFNNGNSLRDFTYVDDIVSAITLIAEKMKALKPGSPTVCDIFNVGNSSPVSLNDYLECIEKALNKKASIVNLPIQEGDVTATYAEVSKIYNFIQFRPETPVEIGVPRMVDWFLKHLSNG